MTSDQDSSSIVTGDEFEVDVLRVAHGGHMIAHHDGRTVFVRHALPGERVIVRVTDVTRRIVRADAIEVLQWAPERVDPPCSWSGPGGCGGCDFQHVETSAQHALKSEVLATSLQRFGGLEGPELEALDLTVHELPGHSDGLRWRSRVTWARDPGGVVGLRRHHSHDIVPVDHCLLAREDRDAPGVDLPQGRTEHVRGRSWAVQEDTFWQVHPHLPEALVAAVLDFGAVAPGETWWDLYAGAGLFAAFIGEAVGPTGDVVAVEAVHSAVVCGLTALADLDRVRFDESDVPRWLGEGDHEAPDGVVLDPPRTGAGRELMAILCEAEIPRIVYVACDPVALARDVAVARALGYRLARVRAFDAFPMTHHLETVALLTRA